MTSLRTGGAEHLLVHWLPRLRDMGHSVGVLLLDGTCTPFYGKALASDLGVGGVGLLFFHEDMQVYETIFDEE